MNYFELFSIPIQLKVDVKALSARFFELSRQFHPDYFVNEAPLVQAQALENSSLLNKAWKTFQQPDETIKYVLMSKNLLEEEEKYTLPPDFLMEVLEINEELMDHGSTESSDLQARIKELQEEIYEPVKEIIEKYDDKHATEASLLAVKEYYYKKKYLDRIVEKIKA